MKMWNKLSRSTRILAIGILVGSVLFTYANRRARPSMAEAALIERRAIGLERDCDDTRDWVERLERESSAAQRLRAYAVELDAQTTGQSLRDLIQACGGEGELDLTVQQLEFERQDAREGFARIGFRFQLAGAYPALVDFLQRLDRAFPPIELEGLELRRDPDATTRWGQDHVDAELRGFVYEP